MSDLRLTPRPLGSTSLRVSPLGLSGSFGISPDDVERAFHEHGVNYFFVTSRERGLNEGVRRLVKAGHRDQIVIAAGANIPIGARIEPAFRSTCRDLGVDHIDVFHLFWVQYHWYVTGKTWPAMQRLKEQGHVGALAVSIHDRPLATKLVGELGLDVLMIRYNAAHRGAEREIFEPLGDKVPGIVAYTATRWGDLLKPTRGFDRGMDPGECYRFVLGNPHVDTVLCGAANYDEVKHDVRAIIEGPLDRPRFDEVIRFGDAVRASARGLGFGT
jgi:aryl-alcohol dehydrogenase-like predicted oxidoreductase